MLRHWPILQGKRSSYSGAKGAAVGGLLGLAALSLASGAGAITQPNGTVIPTLNTRVTTCSDQNVQICLTSSEGSKTIDAQKDALVSPETFSPTCALTFKPVTKGGGLALAFGWYNASGTKPPTKPPASGLYAMMVLTSGQKTGADLAGQEVKLDLKTQIASGAYTGGTVGFWLATGDGLSIGEGGVLKGNPGNVFYTEHALNPGSTATSTYYQVLTWQSVTYRNAFYFGWEDLVASSKSDNDFDDLVFLVSGIQCSGGGQPCETGNLGICADGTMMCQKGELACVQNVEPATGDPCNGLDDDCDGELDEDPCPTPGHICVRGQCVPRCGTGEFRCNADEVCTKEGVCIDPACASVVCESGKVCINGECKAPCTGVTCPFGRTCQNGACVDACANIVCDDGYACVLGVCESCECTNCASGYTCTSTSEAYLCIEDLCKTVTCDVGTHCAGGNCIDNCDGAVCPRGQMCDKGECVADPSFGGDGSGNGGGGSIDPDGGIIIGPDGGVIPPTGSGGSSSGDFGSDRASGDEAPCACRAVGGGGAAAGTVWLGGLVLAAFALMRRRRR